MREFLVILSAVLKVVEAAAITAIVLIGVDLTVHTKKENRRKKTYHDPREVTKSEIRRDKEYAASLYGGYFEESHVLRVNKNTSTGPLTYYKPKHAAEPDTVWYYYKMMDRSADDLIFTNTEEL